MWRSWISNPSTSITNHNMPHHPQKHTHYFLNNQKQSMSLWPHGHGYLMVRQRYPRLIVGWFIFLPLLQKTSLFAWIPIKKGPNLDRCQKCHLINLEKSTWTYPLWSGGLFYWQSDGLFGWSFWLVDMGPFNWWNFYLN